MKSLSLFASFLFSVILLASCSKGGDSSEIADAYVGTFMVTDTVTYTANSVFHTDYRSYLMNVSKVNATTVKLDGINNGCSREAIVTATSMGGSTTGTDNCSIFNLLGSYTKPNLKFSFKYTLGVEYTCSGRAVKQ